MPYEDDYKKWLEEMLIESNPDWVCDGMYDLEFTHEWCGEHCGEDSNYVTPKCLHLYYHHIARADRKTEPTISKMEQVDKPQTDCGDFADRLAYERGVKHAWEVAQKVFDSTVTFYEAEDVAKQIDKDINVRSKDEPQTEREIAKAIVHKMIDDAVIAEDAYPDLRQRMHDAVDEYEPQTDCAWK